MDPEPISVKARSVAVTCACFIVIYQNSVKKRQRRRWWQLELFRNRNLHGGRALLRDLKFQHISGKYKNFTRMSPIDFEYLLRRIGPTTIEKIDTKFRKAIAITDRLCITLRFLATIFILPYTIQSI